MKNILVIHCGSSLNDLQGKEALDLSLIFGAYEQNVSVLFYHNGVTQTLHHQDPELINQKDYFASIKILDIYDIEQVFVCQNSLTNLGLEQHELLDGIEKVSVEKIAQIKQQADHIYVV